MTRRPVARALPSRKRGATGDGSGSLGDAFGAPAAWPAAALRELPVGAIRANAGQPRKRFDAVALDALAESLRARGVLQPVLVRELDGARFELIAGERRWRAAQLAGLNSIPAFVRVDTDDAVALELALIENAAREDLTPVEEARTLSILIDDLGLTQAALAQRVGRSRSDLANTLRLLDLPDDVLDLLADGQLSKGHGKSLLAVPDAGRRSQLARRALEYGWSVRQLERAIAAATSRGKPVKPDDDERASIARSLTALAARSVDVPVDVRARRDGFTIRITAPDLATAESVLARLAATHDAPA